MHGMFRTRDSISESGQLEWRPFHHTLEDLYTSVASYYSLPVLSFRCAVMFAVCRGGVVGTSWTGGLVHECGLLLQPAGAVFQVGKKRFQSHVHSRYSLQLPACTCQLAVSLAEYVQANSYLLPPTHCKICAPTRNAIYNLGQSAGYIFEPVMRDDYLHPNDAGHKVN